MTSAKILVADDESYIRDVLSDALTADGYIVHQAQVFFEVIRWTR